MITADELRSRVLQLINEMDDDSNVTLLTQDMRQLPRHIDALMPQAVLFVQKNRGTGTVNPKSYVPSLGDLLFNGDGTGTITLPSDFVDLIAFRLDGWSRDVTRLYPMDSPMALMQQNPYTRSGCNRPVCTKGVMANNKPVLCFWASPKDRRVSVDKFIYEAEYNPLEGLSGYDEALHNAVAYQCAALLMNVFERHDSANSFMALAAASLDNVQQNKLG